MPGAPHEATFAAVNGVVARLRPQPEFICFPGDEIRGLTADDKVLRRQWRNWLERRKWEHELVEKAHLVLKKVESDYQVHGDQDRAIQSELFNLIGELLNKARGDADAWDKAPIQEAIGAINSFKNSLR